MNRDNRGGAHGEPTGRFRLLQLTARDLAALSALELWGVLGLGQLQAWAYWRGGTLEERVRLFFEEIRRDDYERYGYKRLLRLERGGFVRPHICPGFKKLYLLSAGGHEELRARARARFPEHLAEVSPYKVRHTLAVAGVWMSARAFRNVRPVAERELRYRWDMRREKPLGGIVPDLLFQGKEGMQAMEVELSPKAHRRYLRLWQTYGRRLPRGGQVLYLTGFPGGYEMILRLARKHQVWFIRAATINDWKLSRGFCDFNNYTLLEEDTM
ncbi:MAG: hypothetical protein ABII00_06340 [Elusimicrobiota bacterium]